MTRFTSLIAAIAVLFMAGIANATFTAGMTQQAKTDSLTAAYVTGTPTIKLALGLTSENTTVGPSTTNYSSFVDYAVNHAGHGYTAGGNTVSPCTVQATGSTTAADMNCTNNLVYTATDTTGISADCAVLYNSGTGKIIALYYFNSIASAQGAGATFTITAPTISSSVRGMVYLN